MNTLAFFDYQISRLIYNIIPHNFIIEAFLSFFSLKGYSILIWVITLFVLVLFEEKKDKKFVFYFFIAFLLTIFINNVLLKNIFQRQRPYLRKENPKYVDFCPKDYSFPSGHASTAFASAAILSYFHKKRKYFFYGIAILISVSRVYFECHFFIDIVAGALFGYLTSKTLVIILPPKKNST